MAAHKPAAVDSNKSSESKGGGSDGGFFFFGGDLSVFAGVCSICCNREGLLVINHHLYILKKQNNIDVCNINGCIWMTKCISTFLDMDLRTSGDVV